jgi:hypothetical protein
METKVVTIGKKTVTLVMQADDRDIDMDEITSIDYGNILGEVLTFPVLLNRMGILRTEIENHYKRAELDVEIEKSAMKRVKAERELHYYEVLKKEGKATVAQVEGKVLIDEEYQQAERQYFNLRKRLIKIEEDKNTVESLYWACKNKWDVLVKLSEKIRPEDMEGQIIDETINGILIKCRPAAIG